MLKALKRRWDNFLWQRKPIHERMAIVLERDRVENSPANRAKAWDEFCERHNEPEELRRPIPHWFGGTRISGLRPEEIAEHIAYQQSQGWPTDPPEKYF